MEYYLNDLGYQVQAMHLSEELVTVISVWCGAVVVEEIDPLDDTKRYPALNVQTKEGVKRASLGDYILKHHDGSFDVKTPNHFMRNHRPLEP